MTCQVNSPVATLGVDCLHLFPSPKKGPPWIDLWDLPKFRYQPSSVKDIGSWKGRNSRTHWNKMKQVHLNLRTLEELQQKSKGHRPPFTWYVSWNSALIAIAQLNSIEPLHRCHVLSEMVGTIMCSLTFLWLNGWWWRSNDRMPVCFRGICSCPPCLSFVIHFKPKLQLTSK